jgi:hypothetical protein
MALSFWDKLWHLRDALNYGRELKNKETWKTYGVVVSVLSGLLAAVLPFVEGLGNVDPALIDNVSRGIWGVVGLYNAYAHAATTKSIGL